MKKYWINYYMDFGNTYELAYTRTDAEAQAAEDAGWTQISRKDAEHECAEENARRRYDRAFSNYADNHILPWGYPRERDWQDDRSAFLDGYIVLVGA